MTVASGSAATSAPVDLCLDSSIVVNLLLQGQGWMAVDRVLARPNVSAVLPGPVLTESISVARRKGNRSPGSQIFAALTAQGWRVEHPTDQDLLRAAELLEVSRDNPGPPHPITQVEGTLSLGEALILATTERLGCMVLTRDAYWKWMLDQGLLQVRVAVP